VVADLVAPRFLPGRSKETPAGHAGSGATRAARELRSQAAWPAALMLRGADFGCGQPRQIDRAMRPVTGQLAPESADERMYLGLLTPR